MQTPLFYVVAYLGGVLTILSPCILPVLPFVFARADRPFVRAGLPMLAGMALAFAAVGLLATVAGGWAVEANQAGRVAAMLLLAFFGLTLLLPRLADAAMRPLVALGGRLSAVDAGPDRGPGGIVSSALLGVATGLLWAPCAGPILGLLLTGAALKGASAATASLLLAYAAGAATSMALVLVFGARAMALMKRSLGAGEWLRRGLGVAVLAGVAAIGLGVDTAIATRLSSESGMKLERALVGWLRGDAAPRGSAVPVAASASGAASSVAVAGEGALALPVEGRLPSLAGATTWLNSTPLTAESLKGKVVLVDFWTYSCINCLRALPHVRAWAEKYRDQGLVVIGVHTPEFAFERSLANVKKAVADLGIGYPVAVDNDYEIWDEFYNEYWPAHYFIDAEGRIRHRHFGEGEYELSERIIRQLLAEAGHAVEAQPAQPAPMAAGRGAQLAASDTVLSPETYIGYRRAERFASPGGALKDRRHRYGAGPALQLNDWGLDGAWTVRGDRADLAAAGGAIAYRFHARDLHLVLGPGADGKPVRFRVTVDGRPPGDDRGVDVAADGTGVVTGQRLYQLVRQSGMIGDHTFEIRFLDPGAQAYAFTFG